MQWTGENWSEIAAWFTMLPSAALIDRIQNDCRVSLKTELLDAELDIGDWIICNANGMVFMANDETFQASYVLADEVLNPEGGSHENPLGE